MTNWKGRKKVRIERCLSGFRKIKSKNKAENSAIKTVDYFAIAA